MCQKLAQESVLNTRLGMRWAELVIGMEQGGPNFNKNLALGMLLDII